MTVSVEIQEKENIENKKATNESNKKQRNYYIDILKGIAIISVVFIHTAFHSGNAYVPKWFSNFTVLFEVPMFFFLAGWSYSYSKSNKNYVKSLLITQIKYTVFMALLYIVIKIMNYMQLTENTMSLTQLIKNIFHTYTDTGPFVGVYYSLWFFRVYFFVSLIGAMLITLVKTNIKKYIIIVCLICMLLVTFLTPSIGKIDIGIELSYFFFYMFFYILGNELKDKQLNVIPFILLSIFTIVSLICINKLTDINVLQIEGNKFPPNFVFLLWSLFGVYIVTFLKKYFKNCKKNIISIAGQNSIYIFFAQGIGSTILYWVSKYIGFDWYYKIIIMFAINLGITTIITIILKFILDAIGKKISKFLNEKIYN